MRGQKDENLSDLNINININTLSIFFQNPFLMKAWKTLYTLLLFLLFLQHAFHCFFILNFLYGEPFYSPHLLIYTSAGMIFSAVFSSFSSFSLNIFPISIFSSCSFSSESNIEGSSFIVSSKYENEGYSFLGSSNTGFFGNGVSCTFSSIYFYLKGDEKKFHIK